MAKLENLMRKMKHAGRYGGGRRFYTSVDMAIIKHDQASKNSRIKRGEEISRPNNIIAVCGCGTEGCFIHHGWRNPKEYSWGKGPAQDTHNSGNPEK